MWEKVSNLTESLNDYEYLDNLNIKLSVEELHKRAFQSLDREENYNFDDKEPVTDNEFTIMLQKGNER